MRVAIIDYGSGNLRSVSKAFERAALEYDIKANIIVTNDAKRVCEADRVVLPGVGAYADCHDGLYNVPDMMEAIDEVAIKAARPFFGICVGMQLMAERGLEKTTTPGFGWIKGDVTLMQPLDKNLKIPQIGWNTIDLMHPHILFDDIALGENGLHAYFVHSYALQCQNQDQCLAMTNYGGPVTAAVIKDNLFGTQFHPEKSQHLGLKLIANFLKWKP